MSVLKVENLTYTYSKDTPFVKDAVKGVTFQVEKGEILGVVGHTGSGKSTLVQHLNGLIKPTSGTIYFCCKDIWEQPKNIKEIRAKIGLVFQYPEYQLFDETVYKDISFGPKNMGFSDEEISESVLNAAKTVGIDEDYLDKSPFDLSGGEKRRVAIAGILAMKPEVIVFDEPTAGLDPSGRNKIIDIIKNYRDENNATVVIISHSMEDMAVLADKLLVMNKGELFMMGTPKEIFSQREKLLSCGLDVPMITKVILALKEQGFDIPEDIITVKDAADAIIKLKGGAANA